MSLPLAHLEAHIAQLDYKIQELAHEVNIKNTQQEVYRAIRSRAQDVLDNERKKLTQANPEGSPK